MTMDSTAVAFVVLIATLIASRLVMEAGIKPLTVEEKGRLVEAFAQSRRYGLFVVLAIFLLLYRFPDSMVAVLLAYLVAGSVYAYVRARRLSLPAAYMRSYLASRAVTLAGFCVFVYFLRRGWSP